jgi:hypothetical protein|tara:strand:+ start:575 stop:799 length:225 start_codon:yes stop_codon:yes gene_type:complete
MKCFEVCKKLEIPCKKSSCKYWIDCEHEMNCTVLAASSGPKTLQEIGDIFGVTRMRICQIEKKILKRLSGIIDL